MAHVPVQLSDPICLRDYQMEMYERSLKQNVIVAMDTGSGKTHVALLRIRQQFEKSPGKLMWFLAPTVALCEQQHAVINGNIPALQTRMLIGADNVDRWSEQRIWDAALNNISLVVSTHAVLADAFSHGFVKWSQFSLLIFDEAHHCSRNHPANRIMQHYRNAKEQFGSSCLPQILGLSASPIVRSKSTELAMIESNLDSICVSPRIHRQQLLQHVHRPELIPLVYQATDLLVDTITSNALLALKKICESTAGLGSLAFVPHPKPGVWQPLHYQVQSGRQKQMLKFLVKATHIYLELGEWAADHFIGESISVLKTQVILQDDGLLASGVDSMEILRLLDVKPLGNVHSWLSERKSQPVSQKLRSLLTFLSKLDSQSLSGIVFVQQRATASVLCSLLSSLPSTTARFRCATFVGTSNSGARTYGMSELLDLKAQRETLTEFRIGNKNLIIATDALEEGIDVTACNLVVCFSLPPNVKSFIQRRGRARQKESKFVMMFSEGDGLSKLANWQLLEESLMNAYQSDQRAVEKAAQIELREEAVLGKLTTSKAVLSPTETLAHLHHFCSSLPRQPYTNNQPVFSFEENAITQLITARVALPSAVYSDVRSTSSQHAWKTERAAVKDAAFQAYTALYRAGLLNENLLPLSSTIALDHKIQSEAALEPVTRIVQYNPWTTFALAWSSPNISRMGIKLVQVSPTGDAAIANPLNMSLWAPLPISSIPTLNLFWTGEVAFQIHFERQELSKTVQIDHLQTMRHITNLLMVAGHSSLAPRDVLDFVALITPEIKGEELSSWYDCHKGKTPASQIHGTDTALGRLVRPLNLHDRPFRFQSWQSATEAGKPVLKVLGTVLPKRRKFFDRVASPSMDITDDSQLSFAVEECTIDHLPYKYAQFGMFIPSILSHIEATLVVDALCNTILKDVPFTDAMHVLIATSAPSSGWGRNYEEYEYFGDTLLKFAVTVHLFTTKKNWHEGYLTIERARIVSNHNLAKIALSSGLDKYIRTESVKTRKWLTPLISVEKCRVPGTRKMPTKLLADVVEALIGAAYLDGGWNSCWKCINLFLPEIPSEQPSFKSHATSDCKVTWNVVEEVESLLEYQFRNQSLLMEALTHPSCEIDTTTGSYQRLEFLGDAVLDMLIVSYLADHREDLELSPYQMTLIKAALVNRHFLGYLCFAMSKDETTYSIRETKKDAFIANPRNTKRYVWQFLRFSGTEISSALGKTRTRYENTISDIQEALERGGVFPWLQLTSFGPEKLFSDIVESIIGAIFVDTDGSLFECHSFVTRIGLIACLERIVNGQMDVMHPKMTLQRLAGQRKIEFEPVAQEQAFEGAPQQFKCIVRLDGVDIVEVRDCCSKDDAVLKCAAEAEKKLRETV